MRVIATAGHVDHGKSTLVRALTGMEPDRWAEERRRGMTIDLGYAWTTLPGGEELAFVDVPGHQRFIANMLAGLGPAPGVLFVEGQEFNRMRVYGPPAPIKDTVLWSFGYPCSTLKGSQGLSSAASAMQNVYFPGCPWVEGSETPGISPPMFSSINRMARPIVAFARFPGPKTFAPELRHSVFASGPLTMSTIAEPPVLLAGPW